MLQKSISKTRYFIVVPIIMAMLTLGACSEENSEAVTDETSISKQLTEIKQALDEGRELSETERNQFFSIMEQVVKDKNFPPPPPPPSSLRSYTEGADVPFAVVEQVPVFPGCENLRSNEEQKECMSKSIKEYVTENFDSSLGKKVGIIGVNRVIVAFKISPEGNITDVRARAPHPDLEVEAKRVIEGLPKVVPGEHNGQKVGVSYSLPIAFNVNE